ncbi:CLUMA_CG007231, isoform A [Clunio marinus]|uniref:CLUMA_CG007231, isoform A n=1 Tax=Clunio marinus TaxID=568069 RepID=A0A1J1I023_9DIPT|nr:CLUMA_CG007231, isoform A [Clunio marinus]
MHCVLEKAENHCEIFSRKLSNDNRRKALSSLDDLTTSDKASRKVLIIRNSSNLNFELMRMYNTCSALKE